MEAASHSIKTGCKHETPELFCHHCVLKLINLNNSPTVQKTQHIIGAYDLISMPKEVELNYYVKTFFENYHCQGINNPDEDRFTLLCVALLNTLVHYNHRPIKSDNNSTDTLKIFFNSLRELIEDQSKHNQLVTFIHYIFFDIDHLKTNLAKHSELTDLFIYFQRQLQNIAIPTELSELIFSFLDQDSLLQAKRVSKSWHRIIKVLLILNLESPTEPNAPVRSIIYGLQGFLVVHIGNLPDKLVTVYPETKHITTQTYIKPKGCSGVEFLKNFTMQTLAGYKQNLFIFVDVNTGSSVEENIGKLRLTIADNRECFLIEINNEYSIRQNISSLTDTIKTLAGTGKPGKGQGVALDSQMDEPGGLAVFGNDVLVADTNNNRIMLYNPKKKTLTQWVLHKK